MSEGSNYVGLIAAVPEELVHLVRGWEELERKDGMRVWRRRGADGACIAICGGMGGAAAMRAFGRLMELGEFAQIWSVGWAGSLSSELEAGTVCIPSLVIDSRTGERFGTGMKARSAQFAVTTARVANDDEKARLARSYDGVGLVEMEAATVARLAAGHGIPFGCVKAISDGFNEVLPDLNRYIDDHGRFHTARFAMWSTLRPGRWGSLIRFGRNAKMAAINLGAVLERELENEASR